MSVFLTNKKISTDVLFLAVLFPEEGMYAENMKRLPKIMQKLVIPLELLV